mmetsp:Transcript_17086/g.30989  ORF Transcript_17086/g.30989 Transcript_17086/m.30989 type:complete len:86 (+) Transcript_17086:480-737(+)
MLAQLFEKSIPANLESKNHGTNQSTKTPRQTSIRQATSSSIRRSHQQLYSKNISPVALYMLPTNFTHCELTVIPLRELFAIIKME